MNNNLKNAFTLVELLVVIAIIGILSGLIIVGMSSSTQSANIAKSQIFSNSLRNSLLLDLISEWKFDGTGVSDGANATTAYTQDTWKSNNCSIGGTPLVYSGSNCIYGSCLSFNGTTDYINCSNNSSLNMTTAMTLEAWVKPTTLTQATNPEIICKAGGASDYRMRFITGGRVGARFYGTTNSSTDSATAMQGGVFNHIVISYTGAANLIYFNGLLNISQANSGSITPTTGSLYFASNSGTGEYFSGIIDNVRLYDTSIPTSKIRENYYAGIVNLLKNNAITPRECHDRLSELAINIAKNLDAQNQLH